MSFKLTRCLIILIICGSNFMISKSVFALTDNTNWKPQIVEKMYILPIPIACCTNVDCPSE